ncbi:hypothetical protein [Emticicia sp. C21]|uniref:hypothetical protein n=1 Tax=Emticicia sp. C21 TaxID=2302915 RepID=UPI000E34EC0D|nr:hypothetical protein [Emticicia sp. C21]RFS17544.1 hypothetical protein D0T08_07165 [Emticicia sp. C21]
MNTRQIELIIVLLAISIIFQGCSKNDFVVSPAVVNPPCPDAKLSVTLIRGTTYMGTFTVPYVAEKPIALETENTIESTGVKGLLATLKNNTLVSRGGLLTYTVSGSPDTTGNAVFMLDFNQHSCQVVLPILE